MIRLVCICGQHLQTREEAIAQEAVCPSCGRAVSQSSDGTAPKKAAPLSLKEVRKTSFNYCVVPLWDENKPGTKETPRYNIVLVEEEHFEPASKKKAEKKKRERRRAQRRGVLETTWWDFLWSPLLAWKPLVFFALLLTFLCVALLNILTITGADVMAWGWFPIAFILAAGLGYCCACWYCVLASTVDGKDNVAPWRDRDQIYLWKGMVRCTVCFLAGPAWLLLAAGLFWFSGGDFALIDWLIFGELIVAATVYGLFCLVAVTVDNRLLSASPAAVFSLVRRLGYGTSLLAAVLASAAVLLHGYWVWAAVNTMHETALAYFSLFLCCFSAQYCTMALLRWLGVRCLLTCRKKAPASSPVAVPGRY